LYIPNLNRGAIKEKQANEKWKGTHACYSKSCFIIVKEGILYCFYFWTVLSSLLSLFGFFLPTQPFPETNFLSVSNYFIYSRGVAELVAALPPVSRVLVQTLALTFEISECQILSVRLLNGSEVALLSKYPIVWIRTW
jgi:hypothetical protein